MKQIRAQGRVPSTIVVFGRGLDYTSQLPQLGAASLARVDAALDFVGTNYDNIATNQVVILFSGGWGAAAANVARPRYSQREAVLMREYASRRLRQRPQTAALCTLEVDPDSWSSLTNVVLSSRHPAIQGQEFSENRPLGLVSHKGHMRRLRMLVRHIFKIPAEAISPIIVTGGDNRSMGGIPEGPLTVFYRCLLIRARSAEVLLRREELLVRALSHLRRPGGSPTA